MSIRKIATSAEQLQAQSAQMKGQLKKKNDKPFKNFLRKIGNIFIPMIPAWTDLFIL
ncbi:hypothetical protein [Paenibacillus sp. FSL H7-0918]|jgi:PTS system sucrose-specific IIC component|uniref:hypothetical protein n=1 Tax=Paenibacillus sp. FSL H7-0918 TaxID=2921442 RepID=UPI0030F8ED3A